jgi:hypothetical protein
MALPSTLPSTVRWSANRNANIGPFKHTNGDLYVVSSDTSTSSTKVRIYRSTDNGDTWSVQDSSGFTGTVYSAGTISEYIGFSFSAYQDGNDLFVIYQASSITVAVRSFSMSTNTWGTLTGSFALGATTASAFWFPNNLSVTRRSGGSVVAGHQIAAATISMVDYRRCGYSIHPTGNTVVGWTSSNTSLIPTSDAFHYDLVGMVRGSSDRVHFFYTRRNPAGTTCELYHRVLLSTGVLQTTQLIIGDTNISLGTYNVGQPYCDGTTVYFPYVTRTGDLRLMSATSADSPTWGGHAIVDVPSQTIITTTTQFGNATTQQALAQSFTPTANTSLSTVAFALRKVASPTDNLSLEIRSDSSSRPSGTVLATADNVFSGSVLSTGTSTLTNVFRFSTPVSLTAGTKYWFVVQRSGAIDAVNYYAISSTSNVVTGGVSVLSTGVWGPESSIADLAYNINDSATETINTSAAAVVHDGTNWHAFWINDAQTTIDRDKITSGAWGTDQAYVSGSNLASYTATPSVSGGIPISGEDGTSSGAGHKVAHSFTTTAAGPIRAVTFNFWKAGGAQTDGVYAEIASTLDGTTLATSETVPYSAFGSTFTQGTPVTFFFPTPYIAAASEQVIVRLRRTGARDLTNNYRLGVVATNPYAGGNPSSWDAGAWVTESSDAPFNVATGNLRSIAIGHLGSGVIGILYDDLGIITYNKYPEASIIPVTGSDSDTISAAESFNVVTSTFSSITPSDSLTVGLVTESASIYTRADQIAYAISDISTGAWTPTPLTSVIGTPVLNDSTYITGADTTGEVLLFEVDEPENDENHLLRLRIAKSALGGRNLLIELALYQGSTLIFTTGVLDVPDSLDFVATPTPIPSSAIANITDYGDLRLRLTASSSGGGASRSALVSWAALQTPPAVGSIPVSLSDSGTISATDSMSILTDSTLSITEDDTISAAETYVATRTSTITDSDTTSAAETYTSVRTTTLTDSDSITASDSATILTTVAVTLSDSGTVGSVENLQVLTTAALSLTDSGTTSASETLALQGTLTSNDSDTVSAAETASLTSTLSLPDSDTIGSVENYSASRTTTITDSDTISASETLASQGTLIVDDPDTISATDVATIVTNLFVSLSDSGTITAAELLSSVGTPTTRTDAGTITATESFSILSQELMTFSDSDTIGSTESYVSSRTATITDTSSVGSTESYQASDTMGIADADTISEASTQAQSSTMVLSDGGTHLGLFVLGSSTLGTNLISAVEDFQVSTSAGLELADSGTVTASDVLAGQTTIPVADSDTISSSETYASARTSTLSDTLTVGRVETFASQATVSRSDTGSITATENLSVQANASLADTSAVSASESFTVVRTEHYVSLSDTPSLSAIEDYQAQGTTTFADTSSVSAEESASVLSFVFVSLSDSDTISAAETQTRTATMAITETDTISEASVVSIYNARTVTDTGTVSASETSVLATTTSLTDTGSITASEFYEETEDEVNAFTDNQTISATEGFASLAITTQTDSGTISGSETCSLSTTLDQVDSTTISAAETASLSTTIVPSDSVLVSAIENLAVFTARTFSDSDIISATETVSLLATRTSADSDTISAAETAALFTTRTLTDSDTIALTENPLADMVSTLTLGDTIALGASETHAGASTVSLTDSDTISASDSLDILGDGSTDLYESGEINASETFLVATTVVYSDSDTITGIESTPITSTTMMVSDADNLSAAENFEFGETSLDVSLSDSDTITLGELLTTQAQLVHGDTDTISESSLVSTSAWNAVSDSDTLSAGEVLLVLTFSTHEFTDTDTIGLSELASIQGNTTLADTDSISAAETYDELSSGDESFADADTIGAAEVFVIEATISTIDNPFVDASELFIQQTLSALTDDVLIEAIESLEATRLEELVLVDGLILGLLESIDIDTGSIVYPEPYPETPAIRLTKLDTLPFLRSTPLIQLRRIPNKMPYLREQGMVAKLYKHTSLPILRKVDND